MINIKRTFLDIFSIALTSLPITFAFSSGLVFVNFSNQYHIYNSTDTVGSRNDTYAYGENFTGIAYILFWSIFDPGEYYTMYISYKCINKITINLLQEILQKNWIKKKNCQALDLL